MNQPIEIQTEIPIPPSYKPLQVRVYDGWQNYNKRRTTSEYGKKYARDRICPHCFAPFTRKGIAAHQRVCKGIKQKPVD